jgi:ArsR family transcriptional regulator, arsenate/arsenite/antimonite-responsive transcriptional repressor
MEKAKALTALAALANDARLDLVRLLMPHGTAGLAAGEIGRKLGLSASRLSFHLAALEQAGLIRSRKQARNVFYSVEAGGMGQTIAYLLNDCCMEHPEVVACCRHGRTVAAPVIQSPESSAPAPDRSDRDP